MNATKALVVMRLGWDWPGENRWRTRLVLPVLYWVMLVVLLVIVPLLRCWLLREDEVMATTILLGCRIVNMSGIHKRPGRARGANIHLHAIYLVREPSPLLGGSRAHRPVRTTD